MSFQDIDQRIRIDPRVPQDDYGHIWGVADDFPRLRGFLAVDGQHAVNRVHCDFGTGKVKGGGILRIQRCFSCRISVCQGIIVGCQYVVQLPLPTPCRSEFPGESARHGLLIWRVYRLMLPRFGGPCLIESWTISDE